ncbi:Aste57867_5746 [Aphanomyces stellatus]|uniref:Aste57867_3666 protein n=1 Tax=Aphanomyces stellatus TaxID=120398 RepID=A0A485KHJ2_9STRA|nr:hypothetical protein As57867_005732 [Aphanomyces stellatus]KAF0714823.1 hypothetical protein As57867_003655 [Aphanomyces stellatus]VFT80821.1 Aste57867_3666 [Aphanomyces stellatus]VFT82777.1 Aste57867_5746 [Aphanomyces stellatus]
MTGQMLPLPIECPCHMMTIDIHTRSCPPSLPLGVFSTTATAVFSLDAPNAPSTIAKAAAKCPRAATKPTPTTGRKQCQDFGCISNAPSRGRCSRRGSNQSRQPRMAKMGGWEGPTKWLSKSSLPAIELAINATMTSDTVGNDFADEWTTLPLLDLVNTIVLDMHFASFCFSATDEQLEAFG